MGQVQGVDGGGDRCARFRLRVGLAAGVAVRFDEDRVVLRAPATDRFRSTLLPRSRLNVGPPFQVWPLLSCAAAMAASVSAEV